MTRFDKQNVDLFMAYAEIMGGDLEEIDRNLLMSLDETFHQFTELNESAEPEPVKELQFLSWRQQSRPFFELLDQRVSYLCSKVYLSQGGLLN